MKYVSIVLLLFLPILVHTGNLSKIEIIPVVYLPEIVVKPVNKKDVELIARLIRSEDCNQGLESNLVVAQTVLYKTEKYNTSVHGAIFKTYSKGKAYYGAYTSNFNKKPLDVHYTAAKMILKGYRPAPKGIAYFIGKNDNPNTKWYKYISKYQWKQIGYHIYCFDPSYSQTHK